MGALPTSRRFIGRARCGRVIVVVHGMLPWIERVCPDHRVDVVRLRPVKGTVTAHPCDSRCTSATGRVCECECGGVNHGCEWDLRPAVAVGDVKVGAR
jgi:hypothetical protein